MVSVGSFAHTPQDDLHFAQESVAQVREELPKLAALHFDEIAHWKDLPLEIDWKGYAAVEHAGALKIFTARKASGALIGYAVFFLSPHLQFQKVLSAVQDVLFIHPGERGFGHQFIRWCDEQLRIAGVQVVYHHVKISNDFSPILKRLGYEPIDQVYGRRL